MNHYLRWLDDAVPLQILALQLILEKLILIIENESKWGRQTDSFTEVGKLLIKQS